MNNLKYPTLYGTRTNDAVAYCYYHRCALTLKQMKKKGCLAKQCDRMKRYEDHPYWAKREEARASKKAKKAASRGEIYEANKMPCCEPEQQNPTAESSTVQTC